MMFTTYNPPGTNKRQKHIHHILHASETYSLAHFYTWYSFTNIALTPAWISNHVPSTV